MKTFHPIKFHDTKGNPIYTILIKDGDDEILELRGVTFIYRKGDGYKPIESTNPELLDQFMILDGYLAGFSLEFMEPLKRKIWDSKETKYLRLNELLDEIDAKISEEEQQERLHPFLYLTDAELETLTSNHYIKDSEAGYVLNFLGFQRLKKYLPSLLEYLQDMNWPAAGYVANVIVDAKSIVIPFIQNVFKINDSTWHYWIIIRVLRYWEDEIISILKPDLIHLITVADTEGAAIEALSILQDRKMLSDLEVKNYFAYLSDKYQDDEYHINELNESIKID